MVYVANNPLLYNACLAGLFAAAAAGQTPAAGVALTVANTEQLAAAVEVAQLVDTAILPDATITTTGATTPPTTSAIQNAQVSKSNAMQSIATAAFQAQGNLAAFPAGPAASIAAGIASRYASVITAAPFSLL